MKKFISSILVVTIIIVSNFFVFGGSNLSTEVVRLWYPSESDEDNFTSVLIDAPDGISNLPSYSIEALLNGEGIKDGAWNEIPEGIKLNSLRINDGVAELDFNEAFLDNITPNHSMYFIINSIKKTIFQFDYIDSLIIKVNGEKVEELNGYLIETIYRDKINYSSIEDDIFYEIEPLGRDIPDPVVYLDAGHGGSDPGAVADDGTREADINLEIALLVRDYLENKGATVIMSRTRNTYKDMNQRVREANSSDVDFIVTIHCDTSINSNIRGYRTYYTSTHRVSRSRELAESIDNRLDYTNIPRFNTPTTHDGIGLLLYTEAPAVLIEAGFISNRRDLRILTDSYEQDDIAYNIYVGIRKWWWER